MKKIILALLAGMVVSSTGLQAVDKKHLGGPKGGRFLEATEPKAEFFVEKDKSVTITFYGADLKPVPAADQTASLVAEAKSGKVKLDFKKKGDVLVSGSKLPAGDGYNLVVQFKPSKAAKPKNFRFKYESHVCGTCNRAEYSCICDE